MPAMTVQKLWKNGPKIDLTITPELLAEILGFPGGRVIGACPMDYDEHIGLRVEYEERGALYEHGRHNPLLKINLRPDVIIRGEDND